MTDKPVERLPLYEDLIGYYNNYQSDSLLMYLEKTIDLAKEIGNKEAFNRATIKKSYVLIYLSIYHEALDALNTISPSTLEENNLVSYYETAVKLYQELKFHTHSEENYRRFNEKYTLYRDSLLSHLAPDSYTARQLQIEALIQKGDNDNAMTLMTNLASDTPPDNPKYALTQYNLAMLLYANGRSEEGDAALARSAIVDIRTCTFENASIGALALNLANRGDLVRANEYIQKALADATAYNTSFRKTQILPALTSIENDLQEEMNTRHRRLWVTFWITLASALIIGGFSIVLYKTVKKTHTLNHLLQSSYDKQHLINSQLQEANRIKEECIHTFLTNSVENLTTLEQYRLMVHSKLVNKQYDDLADLVRKNAFAKKEVDDFYTNFDHVVLRIFPNFVEQFNELLKPDTVLIPKKEETLTPELRIFALIRLGVDNPADIAKLLRYSMSTIYNYRVKVRKNARDGLNPEDFESKVMEIGTF